MEKTIQKIIFDCLSHFILLSILLFLPAWSLSFWQAWLYLFAFLVPTTLITLYLAKHNLKLLESRLKTGPFAEKEKSQKIIQGFATLFTIGMLIIPGLDFHYHWSTVTISVVVISDLFIVAGFLIVFFVFKENSYTSAVIEVKEDQQVISTGPYRIVRHPMYSGAIMIFVFTPLALGSLIALPFVIPLILVIVARLLDEEKYLQKNLNGYEEYSQKTPFRLVPYIW